MAYLRWTDSLSVGVAVLDGHHQKLIDLINGVFDATQKADEQDVDRVLGELLDYTRYHFGEEEKLLRLCEYPDIDEHCKIHAGLVDQVVRMRQKYSSDPGSVTALSLFDFLSKWLMTHIIGKDLRYRPFLEGDPRLGKAG